MKQLFSKPSRHFHSSRKANKKFTLRQTFFTRPEISYGCGAVYSKPTHMTYIHTKKKPCFIPHKYVLSLLYFILLQRYIVSDLRYKVNKYGSTDFLPPPKTIATILMKKSKNISSFTPRESSANFISDNFAALLSGNHPQNRTPQGAALLSSLNRNFMEYRNINWP